MTVKSIDVPTDILGVIPARWGSKRFPGKPLALLKGKPLVRWAWDRAQQVRNVASWLVATDDRRILEAVQAFGGNAILTASDHATGTDRIAEVIAGRSNTLVANIQGDEPLLDPKAVEAAISALCAHPDAGVGTAAFPIHTLEELEDPNVVKVLLDLDHRALAFTRSPVPFVRDQSDRRSWIARGIHYRHLGVYLYRREALTAFSRWKPGPLEQAESLEQLRFLEHGVAIVCALVDKGSPGVDTPEDLHRLEQLID